LYGVGEVPISIVSDPEEGGTLDHTIRALGRVTHGLVNLQAGDRLGIRGPYGRGWPLGRAAGRDVLMVTGGLGCAPLVSVINYIMKRRDSYRRLCIVQGVKHANDLIWRERYEAWAQLPQTRVLLAADRGAAHWRWHVGLVTDLLQDVDVSPDNCLIMMCGPEAMMHTAARTLLARGFAEDSLYLSMERNMHCAVRQCGHCQFGATFICRDGPVFNYAELKELLQVKGF
ncbi:MAG: Ni/Fe hydrogenase subunit gamma, partial [Pseudomonas stutzeri]|nr:Ni/Fe hydrogenase subunit gamma [Stutzerimonas stutzeri]NIS59093.1 Ni/Fe hydrogenase subunit gamma [Stutzerimonas stutzeri]NIT46679.1 Ni/Fe hydrogenase subunit gamma [Stutzerimonas stutzeri]